MKNRILFEWFGNPITAPHLIEFFCWVLMLFASYQILVRILLPRLFELEEVEPSWQSTVLSATNRILGLLFLIAFVIYFGLDYTIHQADDLVVHISTVMVGLLIIQVARLLDWYTSQVLIHKYYTTREARADRRVAAGDAEASASKTVKYIVYVLAAIVLIRTFDLNFTIFQIPINDSSFAVRVSSVLTMVLVFVSARLLSWIVTQLVLFSYYRRKEVDPGRRYAINQLVTYFIYVIALFVIIDNWGLDLTVLWGGLAALMVGIGLGMQDVFKDLISGVILLSDRAVEVNDVIDVNGKVGKIKKIGLRTSMMKGRDDTFLILPNSSLISGSVHNWTHQDKKVRFSVKVGVAYGSDIEIVTEILLGLAKGHSKILTYPAPVVLFTDFGDSSLDFELLFWSQELMGIEKVVSELRYQIIDAFKQNNIVIPFPQRDVWIKTPGRSKGDQ